ncbi:MAG TPA: amidohydrolase family protein [Burkholderiales bacterium]|jgi:aminocarboxymuconate-semialdehyde decarboxylase
MTDRRSFVKGAATASGIAFCGCGMPGAHAQMPGGADNANARTGGHDNGDNPALKYRHPKLGTKRKPVTVDGRRIKAIDVHAHCFFRDTVKMAGPNVSVNAPVQGGPQFYILPATDTDAVNDRLAYMDAKGVDMEVLSINPFWYNKNRDIATEIVDIHNNKLSELCQAHPKRFSAFCSLALQYPDLAIEQLTKAMKMPGMRGAAIGGTVLQTDFSDPKFHPVWAKAEELGAVLFIHPQSTPQLAARFKGNGWLSNTIGNALDTTIALEKLIYEGTLDKFPGLKIIAAHGGGYLPSYAPRMDHSCFVSPANCNPDIVLKKKPTEYLNQLHFDTLVFTPEALRHLAAQVGPSQLMIGTDSPIPWEIAPIDHILATPGLTPQQRAAIIGDNAAKLLRITDI